MHLIRTTTIILIFTCLPIKAWAIDVLNFESITNSAIATNLNLYLQTTYKTKTSEYIIAQTDLNSDDINEYILKRAYCQKEKMPSCNHIIIAKTPHSFATIGNVRAHKIVISTTQTQNIRDILAFNDELNDYNFDIYMWSSDKNMYILKPNKTKVSVE
ncbi:MAG: hypothetical protein ACRBDI_00440 [Alphaproteobacteria bacterium]